MFTQILESLVTEQCGEDLNDRLMNGVKRRDEVALQKQAEVKY